MSHNLCVLEGTLTVLSYLDFSIFGLRKNPDLVTLTSTVLNQYYSVKNLQYGANQTLALFTNFDLTQKCQPLVEDCIIEFIILEIAYAMVGVYDALRITLLLNLLQRRRECSFK